MKWVHPEFIFALAVILIPLLIHLFHFKRYKTVLFSSLTFLKSIEQEQKSVRKLKQWLIFAMRALAFTFIVFAFAQPYIPSKNATNQSGTAIIAIYLDNSYSMSRIGSSGELLSQAREIAKSVVNDAPRDAQFVLFTNELSGEEKQTLTKAQCAEKIDKIDYSSLVRSANDVTRWWNQWLSDNERNDFSVTQSQLIYLSDFQKSTTQKITAKNTTNTLFYPIQLNPVKSGNLYVDSIWFDSPIHKLGNKQTVYALVRNESDEAINTVDVGFKIGKINRDVFADIPANGADTVELSYFNTNSGHCSGSITINDQQMTHDDAFYFSYEVRQKSEVLIIDGEDAVPNIAVVYGLDDFYTVSSTKETQLTQSNLSNKDLVVVNGVNNMSLGAVKLLKEFANDGGGLLLFPGSKVSYLGWNNLLKELNMPTLGMLQEKGLNVQKINTKDPFYTGVFEQNPKQLRLPAVKKSYRVQSGSNTLAVDLLTYENGSPFFLKGSGKYNVKLATSSLSSDFSSFTSNQLFSTLLLRTAELSQRNAPYFLIIGDPQNYPIAEAPSADRTVQLKNNATVFLPKVFVKNEAAFLSVQGLEAIRQLKAGNYDIHLGEKSIGALSINYNRLESKVGNLSTSEIQSLFEEGGIKVQSINDAQGWSGAAFLQLDQEQNYWKWCVILAILFVFAEMGIILFYKK